MQSGVISLVSWVGWAVAAEASAKRAVLRLGSALGPGALLEGPGSCGPAVALYGCRAGEVVGLHSASPVWPLAAWNRKGVLPSTDSCSTAH